MDQREHAQMLRALLSGRKNQHALDGASIVRLPGVRLPLRLRAFGKDRIEAGESLELIGMQRIGSQINLSAAR